MWYCGLLDCRWWSHVMTTEYLTLSTVFVLLLIVKLPPSSSQGWCFVVMVPIIKRCQYRAIQTIVHWLFFVFFRGHCAPAGDVKPLTMSNSMISFGTFWKVVEKYCGWLNCVHIVSKVGFL